ncbi:MAG: hypothetical protein HFH86_02370 [Bacilli bacterium]|nr:hypothetical protein [Bacilli bacterium]
MALKAVKYKKSKIKQTRRRMALFFFILFIVLILYFVLHARNYEKTYQLNEFQIKEQYDKNQKVYTFEVTKEQKTFHFIVEHSYLQKKKLLTKIDWLEEDNITCIIPHSDKLKTYPQCIQNEEAVDYHLLESELKNRLAESYFIKFYSNKETYEKIDIRNLDHNTYYIWNYKGFYRINQKTRQNISLFEKDIYDITNIAQVKDYLLIPDYNASYYFNKFYVLQMSNGKQSTWDFKESLYFDGYFMGSDDNSLFYMDRKNKIQWELLPKRKKMRKVGTENKNGKVLENGEWEKISTTKLANETVRFSKQTIYQYEIDNGLYVKYLDCPSRKKISNRNVKEIVTTIQNKVYYLAGESLYYYTEETGEVEVMSYFEWNFNYKNMIFILEEK